VLALDRLSALMLVLTVAVAGAGAVLGAGRRGPARTAFPLAVPVAADGLNGAFLTADLFNLFVFFEVLLAASYGLLLHGAGRARVGRRCTTWSSTWSARRCS
jgi:multicomponent K+:H+ antiporter subunit D